MNLRPDSSQPWQLSIGNHLEQLVQEAQERFPVLNDDVQLEEWALFHKALADETRLKIIALLLVKDVCLCEIVDGLKIPTSTINHHLKILERGGVIEGRREGKFTVYAINQNKSELLPFTRRELAK